MNTVAKRICPDNYQTPVEAVNILLPYIPEHVTNIWEPACGEGKIATALREKGYGVLDTDILAGDGQDFFQLYPSIVSAIVTNPPYSQKDAWIERCFEIGLPFALLLPLEAITGVRRMKSWRKGVGLIIPNRRFAFELPAGSEPEKKSAPHGTTAWFCHKFKVLHGTFEFVELTK